MRIRINSPIGFRLYLHRLFILDSSLPIPYRIRTSSISRPQFLCLVIANVEKSHYQNRNWLLLLHPFMLVIPPLFRYLGAYGWRLAKNCHLSNHLSLHSEHTAIIQIFESYLFEKACWCALDFSFTTELKSKRILWWIEKGMFTVQGQGKGWNFELRITHKHQNT